MRKTGHYRSAAFVRGTNVPIAQAIGMCSDGYPTHEHPIFEYTEDLQCVVAEHNQVNERQQIHLAIFEKGAGAAVVETLASVQIGEVSAPDEKEFIRSQVFLICSGHDVIFTAHNATMRDASVNVLINKLIEKFGGFDEAPSYLLQAALDEEKYREIMDQGIGEIDLGVGGFRQTLEHAIHGGHIEKTNLLKFFASCIAKEGLNDNQGKAADQISGRFILRSGRDWNKAEVKSLMTGMAMKLIDEDFEDGFAIVTKNGLRVTQDSVRLTHDFSVRGNRQIVDRTQLFDGLHQAFDKFETIGLLGDEGVVIERDES